MPTWVSLIAGFVGALIGAGGSILAQELSARRQRTRDELEEQRRRGREEREEQAERERIEDKRRDDRARAEEERLAAVVVELVAASYAFADAAVEVRRAVQDKTLEDEARGRWVVYMDRWAKVMEDNGSLLVSAPRPVLKAAMKHRVNLVTVAARTDDCFFYSRNRNRNLLIRAANEQEQAINAARTSRSKLAAEARQALPDVENFDDLAIWIDGLDEQEAERRRRHEPDPDGAESAGESSSPADSSGISTATETQPAD